LIFKKHGNAPKPSKEIKEASKLTKEIVAMFIKIGF
jgi:hypothetical protein